MQNELLKQVTFQCRKNILEEVYSAHSGHIGGSMSCIDILATLYINHMKYDINNPTWVDRDRLILSKGHCSPALYSILAYVGFFDKSHLLTFRKYGSILQGHPVLRKTPGVDMSTGSLGQGLSIANGIALGAKLDKKNYYIYCIIGDGELQEGQNWEAIMTSAKYKLDNVIVFIDSNKLQIDGKVEDVKNIESIEDKFRSFNWNVFTIDGHDFNQINEAIINAKKIKGKPTAIIANTIKSKGIPFMENVAIWHGKAPNEEQYLKAKKEMEE